MEITNASPSPRGVEWVQIDEPASCMDLERLWLDAHPSAYSGMAQSAARLLLANYFDSWTARIPDPADCAGPRGMRPPWRIAELTVALMQLVANRAEVAGLWSELDATTPKIMASRPLFPRGLREAFAITASHH